MKHVGGGRARRGAVAAILAALLAGACSPGGEPAAFEEQTEQRIRARDYRLEDFEAFADDLDTIPRMQTIQDEFYESWIKAWPANDVERLALHVWPQIAPPREGWLPSLVDAQLTGLIPGRRYQHVATALILLEHYEPHITDSPMVPLWRMKVHHGLGEPEVGADAIDAWTARYGEPEATTWPRAWALIARGRPREALPLFRAYTAVDKWGGVPEVGFYRDWYRAARAADEVDALYAEWQANVAESEHKEHRFTALMRVRHQASAPHWAGDPTASMPLLRVYAERFPEYPRIAKWLASMEREHGTPAGVVTTLERLDAHADPTETRWLPAMIGAAYTEAGRHQDALRSFERVTDPTTLNHYRRMRWLRSAEAEGRTADVFTQWRRQVNGLPGGQAPDAAAASLHAWADVVGFTPETLEQARRWHDEWPDHGKLAQRLAWYETRGGDPIRAASLARSGGRPTPAQAWAAADALMAEGRPAEALAHYSRAADGPSSPALYKAWYTAAELANQEAYIATDWQANAADGRNDLQSLDRAVRQLDGLDQAGAPIPLRLTLARAYHARWPSDQLIMRRLGWLEGRSDPARAVSMLETFSRQTEITRPDLWRLLGDLTRRSGDAAAALLYYEWATAAEQAKRETSIATNWQAHVADGTNDRESWVRAVNQLAELAQADAPIPLRLALARAYHTRWPSDQLIMQRLAWLEGQSDPARAVDMLKTFSQQTEITRPDLWHHLGHFTRRSGDAAGALPYYERATTPPGGRVMRWYAEWYGAAREVGATDGLAAAWQQQVAADGDGAHERAVAQLHGLLRAQAPPEFFLALATPYRTRWRDSGLIEKVLMQYEHNQRQAARQ